MIAITGASGQLGRLVTETLLRTVPAENLVVLVRHPEKVADLAARGVHVRQADYNVPTTLHTALKGIEKLLLISSSEVGQRASQHRHVIDAAKDAGVSLLAYTSLLHAPSSPLGLAREHRETESYLSQSGIPFVLLRNGWYSENYLASLASALQHGVIIGAAGQGRISSATRADYAAAAARVLTLPDQAGKIYELAGDNSWTLADLAKEVNAQCGSHLTYQNLSEEDYRTALLSAGLPEGLATMLADSDRGASDGGLFDDSHQLSQLAGRPTIPLRDSVKQTLDQFK